MIAFFDRISRVRDISILFKIKCSNALYLSAAQLKSSMQKN